MIVQAPCHEAGGEDQWGILGILQQALHESRLCRDFKSSLRSLRIYVISVLNISRNQSYAEITEMRRDRREDFKEL